MFWNRMMQRIKEFYFQHKSPLIRMADEVLVRKQLRYISRSEILKKYNIVLMKIRGTDLFQT